MEVGVAQTVLRQAVECRGTNRTAKRAGSAKAKIVDQHNHNIRRSRWSVDLEVRRQLYLACIKLGIKWSLWFRDRQHRAVELVGHCWFRLRPCRNCNRSQNQCSKQGPIRQTLSDRLDFHTYPLVFRSTNCVHTDISIENHAGLYIGLWCNAERKDVEGRVVSDR